MIEKQYICRVYNKEGVYVTTWDKDIVSNISFNNEINSSGGQLELTLARNAGDYGEGSDVDFGFKVKVSVIDKDTTTEKVIFQGYITSYTPIYKDEKLVVTVLSYGAELGDYIVNIPDTIDVQQTTNNQLFQLASNSLRAQTVKSVNSRLWNRVVLSLKKPSSDWASTLVAKVDLYLFTGSMASTMTGPILATSTTAVPLTTLLDINFAFDEPYTTTAGSTYALVLSVASSNSPYYPMYMGASSTDTYADGTLFYKDGSGGWSDYATRDAYFKVYYTMPDTTVAYLSYDPSDIVKSVLDGYVGRGGLISYDNTTVLDTGTTVSYTFNINTVLEGIQKCVELAPRDWYWYIDYSTNLLHFRVKSTTPDHVFTLGKDIIDAKFEKRIENIVNEIYFSGGDIGGGVNLFKKYTNTDSIAKYGRKSYKYSDQRVTLTATADTIANSILESRAEPELQVTLEIMDSNNAQGLGYDIESIQVGDLVAVRNVTQQVGLSTWDVARWDEAYWDFNIYNLSSLQMQVQKITYNEDMVTIYASTLPIDVNKRIEDINRNLEVLQTINNPTAPS